MSYLYVDIETRSDLDVTKVGAFAYAEHVSTEMLCIAAALDDEPIVVTKRVDVPLWMPPAGVTLVSHNNDFEREVFRAAGLDVDAWEWLDTAALAARMSLPRSLEDLGKFFWPDDPAMHKDMVGNRVMKKLARRRTNGEWWTEETKPEDFETLYAYCAKDVEVMRRVHKRLMALEPGEHRIWQMTRRMNERGVKIDTGSIAPAQEALAAYSAPLAAEFRQITGVPVKSPAAAAQVLGLEDMRKPTVRKALRRDDLDPAFHRALEIHTQLSRSSTAKLSAMERRVSKDGRLRGAMVYCGAERTGRWSSMGVQLQNFPRGLGTETDLAFQALHAGVLDIVFTGMERPAPQKPLDPVGAVAEMLRGYLVGPFVVGDLAQIEARVLGWLAGQEDLVKTFAEGGDPYCTMASAIFGKTVTKKDKDERFIGKTIVLGCFAADTLVLTDSGWKGITEVVASDKLWDGEEWVGHGGVVCRGEKETLCFAGIGVTPDHLLLTSEGWASVDRVARESANLLPSALALGSSAWRATTSGAEAESSAFAFPARVIASECIPSTRTISDAELLLAAMLARSERPTSPAESCTGGTPTSCPTSSTGSASSTASRPASSAATPPLARCTCTTGSAESTFTSRGGSTALTSCATCSRCRGGMTPRSILTASTSTGATSPGTCASSPAERTCSTGAASPSSSSESPSLRLKCETYDIALAGPRSRFTVLTAAGPVIVHNCGYGIGWRGFKRSLDETYDVAVTDDFAKKAINTYRGRSPRITAYWTRLERGFKFALANRSKRIRVTPNIHMGTLTHGDVPYAFIELPSGRRLYYARPELKDDEIRYFGRDIKQGGLWTRISTYGGKLAENVTQAFSRDILAAAMLRLEAAGFPLVGTVHDEVIAEIPPDMDDPASTFHREMVQVPSWAAGLPVDAEVFISHRYRK